jgi:geranylgeranyl diphosphate synthase type I
MAVLACEACGGRAEDALPIALAVELVHTFSLVHDDIIDCSSTRRGRAAVHVKWDEPTAILAGDVLFALAFGVLARTPDAEVHREAAALLFAAVLHLCQGQAMDIAFETAEGVTAQQYFRMIRGKTACLFETATRGGALAAPRHIVPHVDALAAYGHAFGMAFQLADDLLNVTGDPQRIGKPWGSDVRLGKRTLLVVAAQECATPCQRSTLMRVLGQVDASDVEVAQVVEIFRRTGALARTKAARDVHTRRAHDALQALPQSETRKMLEVLNVLTAARGS